MTMEREVVLPKLPLTVSLGTGQEFDRHQLNMV